MNIWASDKEPFEGFVRLELFGHRQLVGFVRAVEIAGAGFLRIDLLNREGELTETQLYNPTAVYGIHPMTEEAAKRMARGAAIAALPPSWHDAIDGDEEEEANERDDDGRDPFHED